MVMIVVPAFAESNQREEPVVLAGVRGVVAALAEEVRELYQWHAVGRDHAGLVVNVAQPLVAPAPHYAVDVPAFSLHISRCRRDTTRSSSFGGRSRLNAPSYDD